MAFRMRKDVSRRVPVRRPQAEQDAAELAYWLSRPPGERVAAVGFMTRRLYFLEHGRDLPALDKKAGRRVPAHDA
ncbi:MAG: hypothetical protein HY926_09325 [Elusimicrobia bacterium]|nr:hypothetical protein [Elusimicrobiota bacterium]